MTNPKATQLVQYVAKQTRKALLLFIVQQRGFIMYLRTSLSLSLFFLFFFSSTAFQLAASIRGPWIRSGGDYLANNAAQ